eukprot:CFRG3414T1
MRIRIHSQRIIFFVVGVICFSVSCIVFLLLVKEDNPSVKPWDSHTLNKTVFPGHRFRTQPHRSKDDRYADELEKLRINFTKYLSELQNPADCGNARYLICSIDANCGFGCQIHRISWCMTHAIMQNRTMILRPSSIRRYGDESSCGNRWNCWFEHVSSCEMYALPRTTSLKDQVSFKTYNEDPYGTHKNWIPPFLNERGLVNITEEPTSWYMGQVVGWLLRYNHRMTSIVETFCIKNGFEGAPDIGIHVRRSDKIGQEANYHSFAEYMQHVDHFVYPYRSHHDYYEETLYENVTVYVATDDPKVPEQFKNYPQYKFWYNVNGMEQAASHDTRWTAESLDHLLLDLKMLSSAEYFVGTFSSQISRLVVELMMSRNLHDTPRRIHSLDSESEMVESLVQYVVLRKDLIRTLGWPVGSVVAQGCHASIAALMQHKDEPNVKSYLSNLDKMTKVVMEVKNESQLLKLSELLKCRNIVHRVWTEQPENYVTALATIPYTKEQFGDAFKKCQLMR